MPFQQIYRAILFVMFSNPNFLYSLINRDMDTKEPLPVPAPTPAAASAAAAASPTPSIASKIPSIQDLKDNPKATSVVVTSIVLTLLAFILAYLLYRYINKNKVNRDSYLLPESKVPLVGTEYRSLDGRKIPVIGNGKRTTIMFWIYLHDIDKYKGIYRHILHRGERSVEKASPLIFLDKNENKIHVRFDSSSNPSSVSMAQPYVDSVTVGDVTKTVTKDEDRILFDLATRGVTIDYIPLQRWVHVAIVVNEEVNSGTVTIFLDGELVKHEVSGKQTKKIEFSTDGSNDASYDAVVRKYQNLNLDKSGNIWVGGSMMETDIGPGFSGLVSKIEFINYDMNASDIYTKYMEGPIDNLASKLGLPAYGVRSPVYRVG